MNVKTSPWIAYRKPNPQATLRLFCFPYAGGAASIYRTWQADLPAAIEVCPVQPPGREARVREAPMRRIEELAEAVVEALEPWLDRPFAFFGHSMGAVLGYEVARRLRDRRATSPVHLLVSGRRAPSVPPEEEPYHGLPDDEFKARLKELNGTPQTVLDHPELMELMLPLLRADFEAIETYVETGGEPLDCPVTGFGGLEDDDARRDQMEPWRDVTRGPFRLRMFPGDHFFIHQERRAVIAAVAEDLLRGSPS